MRGSRNNDWVKVGCFGIAAATALTAAGAAHAVPSPTTSGSFHGSTWTATSNIVGVTSTATVAGGGDSRYLANKRKYSGVVTLIMNEGAAGSFICSGSLLNRSTVLTAGHCVSKGAGTANPISTTVYFNDHKVDTQNFLDPTSIAIGVRSYHVNRRYTGEVIDQNDIAVLRLSKLAPKSAMTYGLYTGGDLTGTDYNIAGYGARSNVGGDAGSNLGVGRLRQGDNRFDFRLGDAAFGGFFAGKKSGGFFGKAATDYSFISDFDNGLAANDASCKLAGAFGAGGPQFCNLGRGPSEVSSAGGDSGGPQFVDGKVASVTSYGLTFGKAFGDIDNKLNNSFGEYNGFVPTYIHTGFINGVPEPASWAMLVAGFGLVGTMARRRRVAVAA